MQPILGSTAQVVTLQGIRLAAPVQRSRGLEVAAIQRAMTRLLPILFFAASVAGQGREITPFIGVQGGGALVIDSDEQSLQISPALGAMLSFDRGRGRMLDLVIAHQDTEAETADVSVDYFQIGGRYFLRRDQRTMPYIAATVGGTRVASGDASAVQFSFAGGVGADIRLTARTALRFDGRLFTTLFSDRLEFECRDVGVCVTGIGGELFQQFIGSAGLAIRF